MEREKQLKYCKKVIHQEFNMQARFTLWFNKKRRQILLVECEHFELDKSKVEKVEKQTMVKVKVKLLLAFHQNN